MKQVTSLNDLKTELGVNENIWLLLYKKGSAQSDCAMKHFAEAGKITNGKLLYFANVNKVRDIHPEFNVTSVPALLRFKNGEMINVVKGCYNLEQFNAIFEQTVFVGSGTGGKKLQKNVTVYTTPTFTWCTIIKRHLQENNIRYREVDVSADQKAVEEMVKKVASRVFRKPILMAR